MNDLLETNKKHRMVSDILALFDKIEYQQRALAEATRTTELVVGGEDAMSAAERGIYDLGCEVVYKNATCKGYFYYNVLDSKGSELMDFEEFCDRYIKRDSIPDFMSMNEFRDLFGSELRKDYEAKRDEELAALSEAEDAEQAALAGEAEAAAMGGATE